MKTSSPATSGRVDVRLKRERERRGIPLPYRNFFKKEEEEEEASRFGVAVLYTACNRAWLNNIDRQAKRKKRLGVV